MIGIAVEKACASWGRIFTPNTMASFSWSSKMPSFLKRIICRQVTAQQEGFCIRGR